MTLTRYNIFLCQTLFKHQFTTNTVKSKIDLKFSALFFYRSQNILGYSKSFVPDQFFFTVTKRRFAFFKIGFSGSTKVFEEAVKFLVWLKKFRLTQNILEPVKGQSKSKFEK